MLTILVIFYFFFFLFLLFFHFLHSFSFISFYGMQFLAGTPIRALQILLEYFDSIHMIVTMNIPNKTFFFYFSFHPSFGWINTNFETVFHLLEYSLHTEKMNPIFLFNLPKKKLKFCFGFVFKSFWNTINYRCLHFWKKNI